MMSSLPIRYFAQLHSLMDLHNLDMVQIFRPASYNFAIRVNFTLLNDPAFRPRHNPFRRPLWQSTTFEDEPRRQQ